MAKIRSQKLFLNAIDSRSSTRKQSSIVGSLTNGNDLFINNYAKVFTEEELGSFDIIVGSDGSNNLQFFPLDGRINEYNFSFITYDINQNVNNSGSFLIGDIVSIGSSNSTISAGSVGTISNISLDYTSSKILVEVSTSNNFYEYTEITLVKDPSNQVIISDFGKISFDNDESVAGIGTYDAYISGSSIKLDFYPDSASIGDLSVNTVNVSFANTDFNLDGVINLRSGEFRSVKTSISGDPSPVATLVGSYGSDFNSSYIISQVTDIDTGDIEVLELFVINTNTDAPFIEYGISNTSGSLGSFSTNVSAGPVTEILFTPLPDKNIEVILFFNNLTDVEFGNLPPNIDLENSAINTGIAIFGSADKTSFDLKYKGDFIFEKLFRGDRSSVVNIDEDFIKIPNHFFVTGEQVKYITNPFNNQDTSSAISISPTTISGVGLTDKLSGDLYVYKVDNSRIKFAASAADSLAQIPNLIDITSVGTGRTHFIESTKQNQKCIITIDNVIQSPINVSSSGTSILQNDLVSDTSDSDLIFSEIEEFAVGDFFKVDDEIMKVNSIDGSINNVKVSRGVYGTGISSHSSNTLIEKINGNYNIVGSRIYFGSAPFGEDVSTVNNFGSITVESTIKSSFHGRVFIRSGITNGNEETYEKNYLFDDLSNQFNSIDKDFTLKSNGSDIIGISTDRSIVLINNVMQIPEEDFVLSQDSSSTNLEFTGTASSISYDQNNASVPRGGFPISIGSSNGFGYQPLIGAAGTATVSIAGTISSVSIGNSGSGYRPGIQNNIRVGVQSYGNLGTPYVEFIGTASISNGVVVGVNITNEGSGYSNANPPKLVIDPPLPYADIPTIYSSSSQSGFGTELKVDIVVGQGSSVIDFVVKNYGYSYSAGDILTIEVGGNTGIPTDPSKTFEEFSINVVEVEKDNFSGWYIGGLKLLDDISTEFDGERKTFFLKDNGSIFSIISKRGSNIDVKATILVVLNDVIQVPDIAYDFSGGSRLTFVEPPKNGDSCSILFYKGTDGIDVKDVDIEDTVKIGDTLQIIGNTIKLVERKRIVEDIISPTSVNTNLYSSVGISQNLELLRPLSWCKQSEDLVVNGENITKNRKEYESRINPVCNLISSVGIGSTMIFVDSLESSFNYKNENPTSQSFIDQIEIIETFDKETAKVSSLVSSAGTITSLNIDNSGSGYLENPTIVIASPTGLGVTATATATITSGRVSSISITNPGSGYTTSSPPLVIVESPRFKKEYLKDTKYSGDYGIITGVSTDSVGFAVTGIVFDLLIPNNSPLRDSRFTLPTITTSQIKENYYFKVFNSNIGSPVESLDSNGNVIGVGTNFLDNIYQVASVSIVSVDAFGYDSSPAFRKDVARVVVSVKNYSTIGGIGSDKYFGEFTWGLIETDSVGLKTSFEVGTSNGVVGLNSTPTVKRFNPLKTTSYNVV